MKTNVGTIDKTIRITLGLLVLSLVFLLDGPERWIGLVGLIPLVTGAIGSCPLYTLAGLTTCGRSVR